jgi:CRP-like cAMP-binding protein
MNVLQAKLEQYTPFSRGESQRLHQLVSDAKTETYQARQEIIRDEEKVDHIYLILLGLAARSKQLHDGRRQIMAFLVPGDLCDIEVFVLEAMDHSIVAMSETTCALIPRETIEKLLSEFSQITKALWWSTMTDSAVLRARIIDHGRRDARERIAHLFYEMLIRNRVVGAAKDDSFPFAVTQDDLADATGLTPVYVNRVLKDLRDSGLVEFKQKVVSVLNPRGLKLAAKFESAYLHLDRTENRDGEVAKRAGDLI